MLVPVALQLLFNVCNVNFALQRAKYLVYFLLLYKVLNANMITNIDTLS